MLAQMLPKFGLIFWKSFSKHQNSVHQNSSHHQIADKTLPIIVPFNPTNFKNSNIKLNDQNNYFFISYFSTSIIKFIPISIYPNPLQYLSLRTHFIITQIKRTKYNTITIFTTIVLLSMRPPTASFNWPTSSSIAL